MLQFTPVKSIVVVDAVVEVVVVVVVVVETVVVVVVVDIGTHEVIRSNSLLDRALGKEASMWEFWRFNPAPTKPSLQVQM